MNRARRNGMFGAGLALLLALPVPALAAAAPEVATEADFLAPLPVVLTVSRLPQPVSEAPAAVTVIDRDMIRASGFTEIADLLRLVPGFNVAFVRGFSPTLAYHGLTDAYSRRMQVLVDGRSIYVPDFGEVRWDDLQLVMEDIDRIEVVRGPDAASYGANAFLAVINIITRHPSQDAGDFVSLRGGSKDFYRAVYRHGGRSADVDYRVTASTRGGSRFDNLPDYSRAGFVDAQADYRLSLTDTIQVRFGWSEGSHGEGYFDDILQPPFDRRSEASFVQLNWRRVQDTQSEISLQYSHTQFRNINEWVVHGLPPPLDNYAVNLNYEAARDDVEFQQTLSPAPGVRLVWAAGARADRTRSPTYFGTPDTLHGDSFRVLAHAEWQASPAFLLHAGAMAERHYFTGTDVSPRLALNYFPAPGHALRIAVTKGYRTPTFYEQKTNTRLLLDGMIVSLQSLPPPTSLRTESILSREIGYLGSLRKLGLEWDLRIFNDQFRDLVGDFAVPLAPGTDLLGSTSANSYRNRISANSTGAEYQLRWRPAAAAQIILSQAYVDLRSNDDAVAHSAPVNSLSLLAMREFAAGISASMGYYQGGPMTWLGEGLPVDAYQRLDLKLAKRWHAAGADFEAAVTLQNVLQPYSEFHPENLFDRRGFVTLNVGF